MRKLAVEHRDMCRLWACRNLIRGIIGLNVRIWTGMLLLLLDLLILTTEVVWPQNECKTYHE
jgi:hypothetical protein